MTCIDTGVTTVSEFPNAVRHVEHLWIPMSDGARLAARMWRPEDTDTHPVPAVIEYIPYRKRDGTRLWDDARHHYLAGHGYACIRLDIRGTGDSEGLIADEYALQEQDDAVEAIAWIASQPWCSGKVGMTGISWGGFNSLQVAARRPPALAAIITHCSTDDRYADDIHYMGGALLNGNLFWGSAFFHIMSKPPDPEIAGEGWRDMWRQRLENTRPVDAQVWLVHQRRDDYWRHGSVCERFEDIECAVYAVGGWADGYSNAVPRLLSGLDCPRKGLVGPWGHKYPHEGIPGPAIGFSQEALRWWNYWLKGETNGIMDEPMYRVWMQGYAPPSGTPGIAPGRWVTEPGWPADARRVATWFLNAEGLGPERGPGRTLSLRSPQSVGVLSGEWCPYGLGGASPDLALDQREDDARSLVFDGRVLDRRLEFLGAPVVTLALTVDQPCAQVAVRLNDVSPQGEVARVTYGILNLTHREGHESLAPMVPGERTTVVVRLNDMAYTFEPGHRLRIAVSACYWPVLWPSPRPVTLDLHAGECTLALPVRPAEAESESPPAFARPEASPVTEIVEREPPQGTRRIERDAASGEVLVRHVEDGGEVHYVPLSLDVHDGVRGEYRIRDDDPLSAETRFRWSTHRRRGQWSIRIESSQVMTATEKEFVVASALDAWEGEEAVFSRRWETRVLRDHG